VEEIDMHAVRVGEFGGPEVLVPSEVPDPVADAGQVVVEVAAADVLYLDTQIRNGRFRAYFPVRPPYVPGSAVAGTVLSVGDGVSGEWVGRVVVARTLDGRGGYAERAVAPVATLTVVPDGLDVPAAAALAHDGPTALALSDGASVGPGEWVLVTNAAGGLGSVLVQLAHRAGARVIGAAGKTEPVARLGADVVVDYRRPDWTTQVRAATHGADIDVVFDGVGGDIGLAAFEMTAGGGRFSAHGAPGGGFAAVDRAEAARRGVRVSGIEQVQFEPAAVPPLTERALAEAAAGRITPLIGQTFPLAKAADAHAAIESRMSIGKTLLLPTPGAPAAR
jgi:NADPH2:quinone reductase